MSQLHAWWNGYEVVAASSEKEANDVLRAMNVYEEQDLEGDGWKQLPDDKPCKDEDGNLTGETFGQVAKEKPEPRHLWSCEP